MNQKYIDTLVSLIKKGVTNPKTGEAFKVDDVLDEGYRSAVQDILNAS